MHNYKDNMAYQLIDAVGTGCFQPAVHAMQNQYHLTSRKLFPPTPSLAPVVWGDTQLKDVACQPMNTVGMQSWLVMQPTDCFQNPNSTGSMRRVLPPNKVDAISAVYWTMTCRPPLPDPLLPPSSEPSLQCTRNKACYPRNHRFCPLTMPGPHPTLLTAPCSGGWDGEGYTGFLYGHVHG